MMLLYECIFFSTIALDYLDILKILGFFAIVKKNNAFKLYAKKRKLSTYFKTFVVK
jgi:hypothetical protein